MTKLRETIAYNKDLITGIETFKKKYKSADAPMINIMTVELFDAVTGEKVYEAKAENVVNNYVAKMAYMDFYYSKLKGRVDSVGYIPPWQVLVLTDSMQTESPDTPYMGGTVIGWANKDVSYIGTDSLRGTVNLSETALDVNNDGLLHYVFDFPTNAANGTFQTVWWNSSILAPLISIRPVWESYGAMIYTDLVFYYNGNIYNVSKSLKYNSDMSNPVSWTPPAILVGVGNVNYYHDGSNLWTFDATNIKKYSADFTTLISSTIYTRPTSIGSELFKCICSNSSDTLWFITSASKIVKYNIGSYTNGTVIKDMLSYSNSPYRALMYWSGKLYYGYKNMLAEFDSDNNITNLFVTPQDSSYGCAYALMADNVNHIIYEFCSLGTNRYGIVAYILYGPPAAQNLLAAAVTKTATNTMKIQYDFQIQKVL